MNKKIEPFFAIGDIHLNIDLAERILKICKNERAVWIGDFNDSHDEQLSTIGGIHRTAFFLKSLIEKRPEDKICLSNHDISYRFPQNDRYKGYGFTDKKCRAFHEYFPIKYWDKFKLFHVENYNAQKIVFSHAGFIENYLPLGVFNQNNLKIMEKIALERAPFSHLDNPLFDDYAWGPLWVRWPLPVQKKINQVVGHTWSENIRIIKEERNWNLCIDCARYYILYFGEDGIFSVNVNSEERKLIEELY